MRITRGVVAVAVAALAAGMVRAQEDDFARLRQYDGQNRTALAAIQEQVRGAAGDAARLATIENGLIGVLEDPAATFAGKQEACRVLWAVGTARSVPALAKLLTSGDEKLTDAARYALERNPDPSAGRALTAALATTSGKSRIGVINSLGDRREAGAAKTLGALAKADDAATADAATIALGKIGTPDAVKALQAILQPNDTTRRALLRGADGLTASGKKGEAEKIYGDLAQSAPSPAITENALRGLTSVGSKRAGTLAITALKKPDAQTQLAAAGVLAGMSDATATKEALAAYPSLPATAQTILLNGWAARGVKVAQPHAEAALSSPDATLRNSGLNALATLGGVSAIPALVKASASGTDDDKRTARSLLATMPGDATTNALHSAVSKASPPERVALIQIIAERGTDRDRAFLTGASSSGDPIIESESVRALGRIGKPEDYKTVTGVLLKTKDGRVRDAAQTATVESAQRLGDREKAAEPLIVGMGGASVETRVALVGALAQIGGDASLNTLTKGLSDAEADIRAASLTGLAESWGDSRPAPALMNLVKTDSNKSTRVQALRGYIRLVGVDERLSADDKVSRLQEAMRVAERPEEKRQILGVVRECRAPSAVALAGSALTDPALFDEAADAVLYLAGPQKKGDTDIPAVKGPETSAALDQVIKLSKDPEIRQKAEKLK